jgi:Tol biopolymer transport system component
MGYELLTGQPPFTGMSAQQILAAHVNEAPSPISIRRATVPPALASILMRCLEKRPADRPQSANEILHVLEGLATPSGGQAPTSARLAAARAQRRRAVPIVAGAALVAVAATILVVSRWQKGAIVTVSAYTQLTFDGDVRQVEISPGGDLIAVARQTPDSAIVYVRDLAGGSTVRIARFDEVGTLRWSPDARSLLVTGVDSTDRWVAAILPRLGGPARLLPCGAFAAWSPDGARIACWRGGTRPRIRFVDLASLDTTSVEGPDTVSTKLDGDWSPGGDFLALSMRVPGSQNRLEIWLLDISRRVWSKVATDTAETWSPRWSPDGKALYYFRDNELVRLPLASDGHPLGDAAIVQRGINAMSFSVASAGRTLVYPRTQTRANVWIATETGRAGVGQFVTRQLTQGTALRYPAELSPDGRWVAYGEYREPGTAMRGDLFVVPVAGGEPRQVTTGGRVLGIPAWSPESDRLAYLTKTDGRSKVALVRRDGGPEVTFDRTEPSFRLSWAPGTRILYQRPRNRNYHFLEPSTSAEEPLLATDTIGWVFNAAALSNDRRVVVYWNRDRRGVWLVASPDSARLLIEAKGNQVLIPSGRSADGQSIYVLEYPTNRLLEVALADGSVRRVIPPPIPDAACTVSEQPRLVLVCHVEQTLADAWTIEDFDPAVPPVKKKR